MQTSNRLLYKGGSKIPKAQGGMEIPGLNITTPQVYDPNASTYTGGVNTQAIQNATNNAVNPAAGVNTATADAPKGGGGMGLGIASAGIDAVMGMLPKKDRVAGAAEKGLDSTELNAVKNTGKGFGAAGDVLGAAGDVAGMIPGPWGMIAKGALKGLSYGAGLLQGNKQDKVIDQMATANAERQFDSSAMNARAMLSKKGGLLYKKPARITSYEEGGKSPEMKIKPTWDHSFDINFPEATMEKKKSVKIFKRGGKFDHPDKTNVIVTGSRHHEQNALGDKGVPVIDKKGEKIFEVEKGELILTKDATEKIETLFETYKKVEVDENKAHDVLKKLGTYFTEEMKENLYNYDKNAV